MSGIIQSLDHEIDRIERDRRMERGAERHVLDREPRGQRYVEAIGEPHVAIRPYHRRIEPERGEALFFRSEIARMRVAFEHVSPPRRSNS